MKKSIVTLFAFMALVITSFNGKAQTPKTTVAISTIELILFNSKTGKKKDLTEFAFMKAGDEKLFEVELKKQIEDFIKG